MHSFGATKGAQESRIYNLAVPQRALLHIEGMRQRLEQIEMLGTSVERILYVRGICRTGILASPIEDSDLS